MTMENPAAIIYNTSGSELAIAHAAPFSASMPGMPAMGTDGSFMRLLRTTSDGTLRTSAGITGSMASAGDVAHDATDSGNPVKIGFKASAAALAGAVAAGDRVDGLADRFGRQLIAQIDPAAQVVKAYEAASIVTGQAVWTPASGKRIAITSIIVATYGTTAGKMRLWFSTTASGDTTYSSGFDIQVLAASFAPGANTKPGLVFTPMTPIFSQNADYPLRLDVDTAMGLDITVHGYEW